jgi:hypothetical protein
MKNKVSVLALLSLFSAVFAFAAPEPSNTFRLGDGAASNKTILFHKGAGASNPRFRWNNSTSKLQFAHNGTTFKTFNLGTDLDTSPGTSGQVFVADGSGGGTWQAQAATPTVYAWSGYHSTDCNFTNTAAAFQDPTADSTCTFVEQTNTNFGTVTSWLSGSDKLPGIVFTPAQTGPYMVCWESTFAGATNNATCDARLIDITGPTTISQDNSLVNTTGNNVSIGACGIYNAPSTSSQTLRLQSFSSAGTNCSITTNGVKPAVLWTIFKIH